VCECKKQTHKQTKRHPNTVSTLHGRQKEKRTLPGASADFSEFVRVTSIVSLRPGSGILTRFPFDRKANCVVEPFSALVNNLCSKTFDSFETKTNDETEKDPPHTPHNLFSFWNKRVTQTRTTRIMQIQTTHKSKTKKKKKKREGKRQDSSRL